MLFLVLVLIFQQHTFFPDLSNNKNAKLSITDLQGAASIDLPKNEAILLMISKPGYIDEYTVIDVSVLIPENYFLLERKDPIANPIITKLVKGDRFILKIDQFEPKSNTITESAKNELDRLAQFLKLNPEINIEMKK